MNGKIAPKSIVIGVADPRRHLTSVARWRAYALDFGAQYHVLCQNWRAVARLLAIAPTVRVKSETTSNEINDTSRMICVNRQPVRRRLFVAERRKASGKFDLYFIGAI